MCSRYNLTSPPEAVRATFGLGAIDAFPPRYNIAPTQPVGIVRRSAAGPPEFHLVRWGLIPGWVRDPRKLSTLINARAETAAEKPSFRGALRHRRCLVPANGFYEWTGPPRARTPHLFRLADGGVLAFAGLAEHWLGADGSELETMAILTVAANEAIAPFHDRMPAILAPEHFQTWLDCRSGDANPVLSLLAPAPNDALIRIEVDPGLNRVGAEGPQLLREADQRLL